MERSPSGEVSWIKKTKSVCTNLPKSRICCAKLHVKSPTKEASGSYEYRDDSFSFINPHGFSIKWLNKKGNRFNWYLMKPGGQFGISWPKSASKNCPPFGEWDKTRLSILDCIIYISSSKSRHSTTFPRARE